ncbi:hypothetical protein W97_01471 [Coniosporium apollinis CBS 100218]|uniref:Pathway-specific nitrogen regulator n=1 Tax=Coniosporium apollinis (strain CBS 100218) TaxID=1168221 RepID=R7YK25_CONA1|nr:uncharacterized protein W97_01471 [Coniosporium apollinis CBS 100218]EON62250.1 hypothetical protein W97_01471 [Coniosporium apollinis CBS 100218]
MSRTGSSPFEIYSDAANDTSFDADSSDLFQEDNPIASVEFQDPADLFSDIEPTRRRISALTNRTNATSIISSMPSELSHLTRGDRAYTPLKQRPQFRNTSSVRALHMSSPPPFEGYPSPRSGGAGTKGRYGLLTPSRTQRSDTLQSARSSRSGAKPPKTSPRPPPPLPEEEDTKKQYPLVLLHITLLPVPSPFPPALMAAVLPKWLQRNFRLLEAKLADPTLMQRGILVSHPGEEYELLEERLLESLELRAPRISKCGHFCAPGDGEEGEMEDDIGSSSTVVDDAGTADLGRERDDDDEADATVCEDCHRAIASPGQPVGMGRQRWDMRVYAANGLMRTGAWAAAWSEMERVDVEISPWIPEGLRRELERRRDEEKIAIAQLEQEEEQKRRLLMEEEESARVAAAELETLSKKVEESVKQMDLPLPVREQRDTYVSGKAQHDYAAPAPLRAQDIPLSILLRNYLYLLARDRRNMVMLLMSVVIIFFCVGQRSEVHQDTDVHWPFLLVENETQCSPVSVVLTTTATEVVTVTIVDTIAPAHEAVATCYSLPVINSSLVAEQHSASQLDTSAPVPRLSVSTSVVTPVLSEPTTAPEISAGKPDTVKPHVEGVPTEQPAVPDSPLLEGGQSPAPAAPEGVDSVVTQGVTAIDVLGRVSDGPMEMSED